MLLTMKSPAAQKSVAVPSEIAAQWAEFHNRYPRVSFTEVTQAALRLYFYFAQDGIDGNLRPLNDLMPHE